MTQIRSVCISSNEPIIQGLEPAMRFLLSLIIPERNVENGYDYWSNYSDKSLRCFLPSFIQRSFFRSCFLFQQNLEWEKAILGQLVRNMGKNDAPAVLQRHFPTFGILQRSNHASQQRVVLPLSMMLGVHEQWFGHICCIWTANKSFISRNNVGQRTWIASSRLSLWWTVLEVWMRLPGLSIVSCDRWWYNINDHHPLHPLCSASIIYRINLSPKTALFLSQICIEYTSWSTWVLTTRVAWQALHGIMFSSLLSPVRSISRFLHRNEQ